MTKNSKNWRRKCIFATVIRLSLVNITDMSLIHIQDNVKTSYNNYIIQQLKFSYISVKEALPSEMLSRASFFLKVRLRAEKLVNGKEKRNTASDRKIKETRPQFSINSAIGFEYNLTKESSIYIEPGINHYINNGSSIDNIYKTKPNNFCLNIGFRVYLNR